MKKLFILFNIFLLSNGAMAQLPLSHDTNFVYMFNDPHYVLQQTNSIIEQVIKEPNGTLIVRSQGRYIAVNGFLDDFKLLRLNSQGVVLPFSFNPKEKNGNTLGWNYDNNIIDIKKFGNNFLISTEKYPFLITDFFGNISQQSWAVNDSLNLILNNSSSLNNSYGNRWFHHFNMQDSTLTLTCRYSENYQPCFSFGPSKMYRLKGFDWQLDTAFQHDYIPGNYYSSSLGIVELDNEFYGIGYFNGYGGHESRCLIKMDANLNPDTTLSVIGIDTAGLATITPLFKQADGKLLCSGIFRFPLAGGVIDTLTFFRLNTNWSIDTTFNSQSFSKRHGGYIPWVRKVFEGPNNGLLVFGNFVTLEGTDYTGVAMLDANGFIDSNYFGIPRIFIKREDSSINPPSIRDVIVDDNGFFVAGDFNRVDSADVRGLVRLNGFWPLNTPKFSPSLQTMQLYPNPAQNQVRINLGQQINKAQTLFLRDVSGKLVKTFSITEPNQTLDIGGMARGMYFVSVSGYKTTKLIINY